MFCENLPFVFTIELRRDTADSPSRESPTKQVLLSPDKPPIPTRTSSRQESPVNVNGLAPTVITMEQLQRDYGDIAKYKIFQLAGTFLYMH